MKGFPNGLVFMQQLHWKNQEQLFREQCEKISQVVNSNFDCDFFLKFFIKSEKHKLAVIDKRILLTISPFWTLLTISPPVHVLFLTTISV